MRSPIELRRRDRALLIGSLLFASLGPPLGVIGIGAYVLLPAAFGVSVEPWYRPDWPSELTRLLGAVPMAYVVGTPSAGLCGLLYTSLLLRRPDLTRRNLLRATVSGFCGAASAALFAVVGILAADLSISSLESFLVAGAFAGLVCAFIVNMESADTFRSPISPNTSPERTPER